MRILTEPKNALVKQYQKLFSYDDVSLSFDSAALEAVADLAIERNIGARGLRAVMEGVLTKLMYEIPSDPTISSVTVTAECVKNGAAPLVEHVAGKQMPRAKVKRKAEGDGASAS